MSPSAAGVICTLRSRLGFHGQPGLLENIFGLVVFLTPHIFKVTLRRHNTRHKQMVTDDMERSRGVLCVRKHPSLLVDSLSRTG